MCTKSNLINRIVVIKTIDRLFYEPHNAKRCHKQVYRLYVYPLYGICPESNRNYRKSPDELLERYPLPEHLDCMLRLDVGLVKVMSPGEAAKVLNRFCKKVDRAIRCAKQANAPLNAATILNYLDEPV